MPTLDDLLQQTMFFTAMRGAQRTPLKLSLDSPFHSPAPSPRSFAEVGDDDDDRQEAAYRNAIWRLAWDPASPGTFTDVTCRTRGMSMDYAMPAKVLDKVEFRGCQIEREDGGVHDLDLSREFMIGAWWQLGGLVAGGERLWPLRSKLDVSVMVAFAYQLTEDGRIEPLSMSEIEELGDELIPTEGWLRGYKFSAGDPGQHYVCVGPCRYIVAIELVLAKERPDFVPGEMVGFARVGPHGFVWANEALKRVELTTILERPSHGMQCDPSMQSKISGLLVTDTNEAHSVLSIGDLPFPYTDNLYDYYQVDGFEFLEAKAAHEADHPRQRAREASAADPIQGARFIEDAVERRSAGIASSHTGVRKCARQGQFDSVHLAARMKAEFEGPDGPVVLDDIVMINQCLHDCLHTHVRWSEFLDSSVPFSTKMLHGWGPSGPYTVPGAPQVPVNQAVFLSLPKRHALAYRAVASECSAGAMQVFFHHGSAYAIDQWPGPVAASQVVLFHAVTFQEAIAQNQIYSSMERGGLIPFGWLEFYWRMRWTAPGRQETPVERLACDMRKCLR